MCAPRPVPTRGFQCSLHLQLSPCRTRGRRCPHTHMQTHVHTRTHMHTHVHMCTQTHTRTHVRTHTCMHTLPLSSWFDQKGLGRRLGRRWRGPYFEVHTMMFTIKNFCDPRDGEDETKARWCVRCHAVTNRSARPRRGMWPRRALPPGHRALQSVEPEREADGEPRGVSQREPGPARSSTPRVSPECVAYVRASQGALRSSVKSEEIEPGQPTEAAFP